MPRVGNRKFDYSPEGRQKAKEYAEKTGQRKRDKNLKNKGRK